MSEHAHPSPNPNPPYGPMNFPQRHKILKLAAHADPAELAPRFQFESGDFLPVHVFRTKSVSVVMLKNGRWGVARVRGLTGNGPPYVHESETYNTRGEAERAAYALAHKLGLADDGWA